MTSLILLLLSHSMLLTLTGCHSDCNASKIIRIGIIRSFVHEWHVFVIDVSAVSFSCDHLCNTNKMLPNRNGSVVNAFPFYFFGCQVVVILSDKRSIS